MLIETDKFPETFRYFSALPVGFVVLAEKICKLNFHLMDFGYMAAFCD